MRIGFFGLFILLLIALKLTGYIAWSWWWIVVVVGLLPLGILLLVTIIAAILAGLIALALRGGADS